MPGSMVKKYCGEQQQQQEQSVEPASQPPGESASEGDVNMVKMRPVLELLFS